MRTIACILSGAFTLGFILGLTVISDLLPSQTPRPADPVGAERPLADRPPAPVGPALVEVVLS